MTYPQHPDPTVVVPLGWITDPDKLAGVDQAVRVHLPPELGRDLGPLRRAMHHGPGGISAVYDLVPVYWRGFGVRLDTPGEQDRWWHLGRLLDASAVAEYVGPRFAKRGAAARGAGRG